MKNQRIEKEPCIFRATQGRPRMAGAPKAGTEGMETTQTRRKGEASSMSNELKFERLGDANKTYPASTLVIRKQFVDAAIDELKDKCQMHDFFWEGCGFAKRGFKNTIAVSEAFDKLEAENAELKAKLESVQATAYAESVDAGMRERKLQRALWLARALRARDKAFEYHFKNNVEMCAKWDNVHLMLMAKAEEYK